jgi:hypothetical protein
VDQLQRSIEDVVFPILDRIHEFRSLPENWDSYGAAQISNAAADWAASIAGSATFATWFQVDPRSYSLRVFPLAEGGIQLEWETAGRYLEVEIGSDTRLSYLYLDKTGESRRSESAIGVHPKTVIDQVLRTIAS